MKGWSTAKRTKVVCTIGPASASPEVIEAMLREGMDVARLNFSHGTREEHARVARTVREVSERVGRPVAVLGDLAGGSASGGWRRARSSRRARPSS